MEGEEWVETGVWGGGKDWLLTNGRYLLFLYGENFVQPMVSYLTNCQP